MPPYVKEMSFSTTPEGIDFSSREMYNDKKRRGYGGIGRRARFRRNNLETIYLMLLHNHCA